MAPRGVVHTILAKEVTRATQSMYFGRVDGDDRTSEPTRISNSTRDGITSTRKVLGRRHSTQGPPDGGHGNQRRQRGAADAAGQRPPALDRRNESSTNGQEVVGAGYG